MPLPPYKPLKPQTTKPIAKAPPAAAAPSPDPTAWSVRNGAVNGPGGYPSLPASPSTAPSNLSTIPGSQPRTSGWVRGAPGFVNAVGGVALAGQVMPESMNLLQRAGLDPNSLSMRVRGRPIGVGGNSASPPAQPYAPPAQALPGVQTAPQAMPVQPAGPSIAPIDTAINDVTGIAQRLRGLPTMQSERIAAESRARQNLLNTRDEINAGLQARNARALSGLGPVASAGQAAPLPQPQPQVPQFATTRMGQTPEQAGSAYDAARTEGATRLQGAAQRILTERGDTYDKAQVARVGQNSTLIRTPDGRINVVGNRNRQLIGDSATSGDFQQAMANQIRSQAVPTGSIVSSGRSQPQLDARALRAQRVYGLPKSTPAVAAAMERGKVGGGTTQSGLPAPPASFKEAVAKLQAANEDPALKQFGVTATSATPSQVAKMLANPDFQSLPEADHTRVRAIIQNMLVGGNKFTPKADVVGGLSFKPEDFEQQAIGDYVRGGVPAMNSAMSKLAEYDKEYWNRSTTDKKPGTAASKEARQYWKKRYANDNPGNWE